MNNYLFDVKMFASVRINAASKEEAEATIMDVLDAATCNAGQWPNGDPIVFEASIDGELDLVEINGEYQI